jgi:hypothetical protein
VQQIVNAVAHAYLSEVVDKDRGERLARHDMLAIKYKELLAELRTRRAEEKNLNEANGDIEVRRTEIQQLQATIDQMAALLTEAAIDIGLPVRVELIEEASVPSDAS